MFKTLIKTYIESRLNAIDAEVEDLADKIIEEEEKSKWKKCNSTSNIHLQFNNIAKNKKTTKKSNII